MPDITKRPFTSSTFTFGHDKPISPKSTDSQLRANALSLTHDQLQSVVTQLIQFHPSSKAAIAPLIASTSTQTSATLDDSQSKHFATEVKNCKYWLSDTWWAGHPSLPDGYACQVSRKAVRKEVGDTMTMAKPTEFKLQKTHEQCEIILDAIVALIDIAQAVLRRKGTPSGYCRSDRSLGQHIGEQLYDLIYTTSSASQGRLYAHEDCIWEHVLVPRMEPHPARVAIAALAEMPPAPSNDDLFLYRTLRPVLSRVALDAKYYCEHGVRRVLMDDMPDFESMDISKEMDSDSSDTGSEDEGNRRSKRRSG
jgi:hypothetical protein